MGDWSKPCSPATSQNQSFHCFTLSHLYNPDCFVLVLKTPLLWPFIFYHIVHLILPVTSLLPVRILEFSILTTLGGELSKVSLYEVDGIYRCRVSSIQHCQIEAEVIAKINQAQNLSQGDITGDFNDFMADS